MPTSVFLDLANAQQFTGPVIINVNGIATTSTDGLSLINGTAATASVTVQRSPALLFSGSAWNSVGLASETDTWRMEERPVSVAGTTTSALFFSRSIAGGAYSDIANINSGGTLSVTHKVAVTDATGEVQVGDSGFIYWQTRAVFTSPANGQVIVSNNAVTAGFLMDGATDGTARFLTRAAADSAIVISSQFQNSNATNGQTIGMLQTLTELTTIAAAATTDTTIQMPAGAVVLAVTVRVTVVIPTATNFTVGDSGSAARFSTAAVSSAATSTDKGTKAGAYYNASALSVRITPDLTPANNSGRVRVTIYYYSVTPSTS